MAITKLFQPPNLFRYRAWNNDDEFERELRCISDSSLWSSKFKNLNDPMEGKYKASFRLKKMKNFQAVREKIFNDKMAMGICSFSETNDNAVMWTHYANQFSGICIEYNFKKLLASLPNEASFVRMSYNEKSFRVSSHDSDDTEIAQKILSSKSYRWLYEREWRAFFSSQGPQHLASTCISRIYLGYRINAIKKEELQKNAGGFEHTQ